MYSYVHIWKYICIDMQKNTEINDMYVYVCICMHMYSYVFIYVYIYICMPVYVYVCVYMHMYTCVHIRIYAYIYVRTDQDFQPQTSTSPHRRYCRASQAPSWVTQCRSSSQSSRSLGYADLFPPRPTWKPMEDTTSVQRWMHGWMGR